MCIEDSCEYIAFRIARLGNSLYETTIYPTAIPAADWACSFVFALALIQLFNDHIGAPLQTIVNIERCLPNHCYEPPCVEPVERLFTGLKIIQSSRDTQLPPPDILSSYGLICLPLGIIVDLIDDDALPVDAKDIIPPGQLNYALNMTSALLKNRSLDSARDILMT